MNNSEFEELAVKVLTHQASSLEIGLFQAVLAKDEARQREFQVIKETTLLLRQTLPLTHALKTKEPELPEYRMGELRTALREAGKQQAQFPQNPVRHSMWHPLWSLRAIWGGTFAVATSILLIFFSTFYKKEIEVGLYEGRATRSDHVSINLPQRSNTIVLHFEYEETFEHWQNQPLSWRQKAKIWVDEEKNTIQIMERSPDGTFRQRVEPLANDPSKQAVQLEKIIHSFR